MADGRHLATHPDENLLSAFTEHSLTPKERQSVLEHLSACARCRDVVFLAQQAFSETGDEPERVPLPAAGGRRWLWWGPLGVAGVLAVLLIAVPVAVHRYRGHPVASRAQEIGAEARLAAAPAAEPGPSAGSMASARVAPPEAAGRREAKRASSAPAVAPTAKVHAGGTAEIAGSVADRSGAAIPGAHVTVRAAAGGNEKSAVTNAQGQFHVAALPSGDYKVEVQAPGFEKFSQPLTVQPSERASLDAKLDVGAASQTVTVSAADGTAEGGVIGGLVAGSGTAQGLITNGKTSNMPLEGRNPAPAAEAVLPPPAKPATASAAPAPAPSVTGGPAAAGSRVGPVATFALKDGLVQRCLGGACSARPLPSGARAVSVAAGGQMVMALDGDGNVFLGSLQSLSSDRYLNSNEYLNNNQGASWTQATVQWVGKAVGLRVEPPAQSRLLAPQSRGAFSSGTFHGAAVARSAPAAVPPRATFELTNDKGQVWVSSDEGKTWVTKQ